MLTMIRTVTIAAAALTMAAPALADEAPRKPTATGVVKTAPAANPNQKICVKTATTGSRITRTTCRSRAEWAKLGEDFSDL